MSQNWELRKSAALAVTVLFVQLMAAAFSTRPVIAAELKEVLSFGDNPSSTRMFIYVPDKLAASPPVLVAVGRAHATSMAAAWRK